MKAPETMDSPGKSMLLPERSPGTPRARVVRQVKEWIESGAVPNGQPLPSERTLAERFEVDRRTVRGALNVLSAEGFLRSNGGRLRLVVAPHGESVARARKVKARSGLMRDAIVVLTASPVDEPDGLTAGGWSGAVLHGATQAISAAGLHSFALHPDRLSRETVERLAEEGPYGVVIPDILNQRLVQDWAELLSGLGIPVVIYGDSAALTQFDRVTSDHEAGAYALTRWLIESGRKRILNLWPAPATNYWFAFRRAGYERAMREAGLEILPSVLVPQVEGDREAWARVWGGYLIEYLGGPNCIDAIMMASDGHIDVVASACRLFGKEPNRDVAIVGYDNYYANLWDTDRGLRPLATVDKANRRIGEELVRLLVERVSGRLPAEPQYRVVAPQMIVIPDGTNE